MAAEDQQETAKAAAISAGMTLSPRDRATVIGLRRASIHSLTVQPSPSLSSMLSSTGAIVTSNSVALAAAAEMHHHHEHGEEEDDEEDIEDQHPGFVSPISPAPMKRASISV
jgi:hypothetical protein